MMKKNIISTYRLMSLMTGTLLLSACQPSKLAMVGQEPPLAHIKNPTQFQNYRPVTMPMPAPQVAVKRVNSLWQDGATSFFKDQRARSVGDILTVQIEVEDTASIEVETELKRSPGTIKRAVGALAGFQKTIPNVLPQGVTTSNLFDLTATSDNKGDGSTDRTDKMKTKIAATVTQVLPNGNLVIWGHQELRVNFEVRDLTVTGIVRPEDVSGTNMVHWNKIAEARMTYGGRGHITNVQQPTIAQQVVEAVSPF